VCGGSPLICFFCCLFLLVGAFSVVGEFTGEEIIYILSFSPLLCYFMFCSVRIVQDDGEIHRKRRIILTLVLPSMNRFWGIFNPILFHVGEIHRVAVFKYSRSPPVFLAFMYFVHFDTFAKWGPM